MTMFSIETLTSSNNDRQAIQTQPISPTGSFSSSTSNDAHSLCAGSPISESSTPDGDGKKPTESYIALIARAILSVRDQKMLLCDIYQHIMDNYPFYRNNEKSWRNSIRHNLSLNECFIKNGRSNDGRGNFWSIHPANLEDFIRGDFRRRKARRRVRQCYDLVNALYCRHPFAASYGPSGFVPMTSTPVPYSYFNHPSFNTPMYQSTPSMYSPPPPPHHYTACTATTTSCMSPPQEPVPSSYCSPPLSLTQQQAPLFPAPIVSPTTWQDTFSRLQAMK